MTLGTLTFNPLTAGCTLVAKPVLDCVERLGLHDSVLVAEIDPNLADTASFCEQYDVPLALGSNCLVLEAKRGDKVWYAACLISANDAADVNGTIRRQLDARKISFAPMETALALTGMEYGGITPVGLPADWPILVDSAILAHEFVVMGGGVRGLKLAVATKILQTLPNVIILPIAKAY